MCWIVRAIGHPLIVSAGPRFEECAPSVTSQSRLRRRFAVEITARASHRDTRLLGAPQADSTRPATIADARHRVSLCPTRYIARTDTSYLRCRRFAFRVNHPPPMVVINRSLSGAPNAPARFKCTVLYLYDVSTYHIRIQVHQSHWYV